MLPPQLKNILLTSSSLYSRGPTVLPGLGSKKQWFSRQPASLMWAKSSWLTFCNPASAETHFLWTFVQDGFLHVASKSISASEKCLVSPTLKKKLLHMTPHNDLICLRSDFSLTGWPTWTLVFSYTYPDWLLVLWLSFSHEQQPFYM